MRIGRMFESATEVGWGLVLGCVLLWVTSMRASAQFEGEVEFWNKTTTDETGSAFEYLTTMTIKGTLLRVHTSSTSSTPASTMIYRIDRGLFWTLNEDEKSYFEVRTLGGRGGEIPDSVAAPDAIRFRPTGQFRTILGYRAEQYLAEDGERKIEIWGTEGLKSLAAVLERVFESAQGDETTRWNDELAARGIFPMISRISLNGQVVESSEVRRISRGSVSDEMFLLPPGYRKVSIDEFFEEPSPPK